MSIKRSSNSEKIRFPRHGISQDWNWSCLDFWVSLVAVGKESARSEGDVRDLGSISGSGRTPGEGNGNSVQYLCLENFKDRRVWWATVHRVSRVRHNWATKPPTTTARSAKSEGALDNSHLDTHRRCNTQPQNSVHLKRHARNPLQESLSNIIPEKSKTNRAFLDCRGQRSCWTRLIRKSPFGKSRNESEVCVIWQNEFNWTWFRKGITTRAEE